MQNTHDLFVGTLSIGIPSFYLTRAGIDTLRPSKEAN